MFTGIIKEVGSIKGLSEKKGVYRLVVFFEKNPDPVKQGQSIAVNGVCLTAVDINKNNIAFDIMEETFNKTALRYLKKESAVNIERALRWEDRLDGHFVLGHIDGCRKLKSIKKETPSYLDLAINPDDRVYIAEKGSIALDGISLTVGGVYGDKIRIYMIPYTINNTNLKYKKPGDWINVEFDILGKYTANGSFSKKETPSLVTKEFLKEQGFI